MIHTAQTYTLPVALPLEEGSLLVGAEVAFERVGPPGAGDPVVILHDLDRSHRGCGDPEAGAFQPSGWARGLVGPGLLFDPARAPVIFPNLLGSPYGSTSPVSPSETGQALGPGFPRVSTEDMARALAGLLRALEVRRVRALVGVGLGGMVALRTATLFPQLVSGVIAVGAAKSLPEALREQLAFTGQLIGSDPDFHEGAYLPGEGPFQALKKVRLEWLRRVHDPSPVDPGQLEEQAEDFARTFDANAYISLCQAYASCDLTPALPKTTSRVLLFAGSADRVAPASRVRETYHLLTAAGVRAHYVELQIPTGHEGLLADPAKLHGAIAEFLSSGR